MLGKKSHPRFMIMHEKWVNMKARTMAYRAGERVGLGIKDEQRLFKKECYVKDYLEDDQGLGINNVKR
jgi:hypothetical protein